MTDANKYKCHTCHIVIDENDLINWHTARSAVNLCALNAGVTMFHKSVESPDIWRTLPDSTPEKPRN